jgi:hypothetical protein
MLGVVCGIFTKAAKNLAFVLIVVSLWILVYIALVVQSTVDNFPEIVVLVIVSRAYVPIVVSLKVMSEPIVNDASQSLGVITTNAGLSPPSIRLRYGMAFAVVFVIGKRTFVFTILIGKVSVIRLQEIAKSQTMNLVILLLFAVAVMVISPVSLIYLIP